MKPRSYSDEAIILARRNYGECDRILSVYTKRHGRIALMAKGVRSPKSKKRGHIEVFNYVKFSAVSGRGLDLMTEAEIIDTFKEIRASLKKVVVAYFFMEGIGRTTHENEPHEEIFNLALSSLNRLRKEKELKKLRAGFIYELITLLGFWPKGQTLLNPDSKLEEVIERKLSTLRVGKRILVE